MQRDGPAPCAGAGRRGVLGLRVRTGVRRRLGTGGCLDPRHHHDRGMARPVANGWVHGSCMAGA